MSNEISKQHPCESYDLRKGFAIAFDMHFWGEGCPYKCDKYDDMSDLIYRLEMEAKEE